jgi:adenosylmethionine-8-amino-7-oxononanoate aminotransferase
VKNKQTKEPFDLKLGITQKIFTIAISAPYNITIYPGTGTTDRVAGDHIILAPTYIVNKKDIKYITKIIAIVINYIFKKLKLENL